MRSYILHNISAFLAFLLNYNSLFNIFSFFLYYFFFYAQFFHEWWVVKIVLYMLVLLLLYSFFNFDIFYSFKTSLTKWLSVCLRSNWLGFPIPMLSLKLKIWRLLQARSSLTFRQTIECGFILKLSRDIIKTYTQLWWCQQNWLL